MVKVNIRVENARALRFLKGYPEVFGKALARWTLRGGVLVQGVMREVIRERQKHGTGALSNSVQAAYTGKGFEVGPTVDYAEFVDQPTRPHEIRPRNKKVLAFAASGGRIARSRSGKVRTKFPDGGHGNAVFATVVHHPGTKGMFFIDETVRRTVNPLSSLLDEELQRGIKEADES